MYNTKLHPSVPIAPFTNVEWRLEKKTNNIKNFKTSINNLKEVIIYFKDENRRTKKGYKNYKVLPSIFETIDNFVIIATTSSSATLTMTSFGMPVIPISTGIAFY